MVRTAHLVKALALLVTRGTIVQLAQLIQSYVWVVRGVLLLLQNVHSVWLDFTALLRHLNRCPVLLAATLVRKQVSALLAPLDIFA